MSAPSSSAPGLSATALLERVPLFEGVPKPSLRRLAATTARVSVHAGRELFGEDDHGRDVFVVVSGRLEVLSSGRSDRIAWIGPHGIVGERAMLDGGQRCATVRATRDSDLLLIPGAALERVLVRHPVVLRRLSATVADRVRMRVPLPTPGATTVAVVATGSTDRRELSSFCERLAGALRMSGATAVVDARASGTRDSLHAIEANHRFVVYAGSGLRSEWTKRCVRQADRVLLVANSSAAPQVRAGENRLIDTAKRPAVRCDLVLLHDDASPAAGTIRWLQGREVDGWHHVTADSASLDRLARHLSGEAVGLVLGGGGARGLAHLGVMRALEDSEVPVDSVGGTSIGAIMGAFAALGWSDEQRMAIAKAGFIDTPRLVGYTLPLLSLSSSKKLTRLLRQHLGDVAIEDLPVPFFCISANYSTGEVVVHDRGPLWWAVRASISLPGILPPVFAEGDLLVDGGVVNNLPVDIMRTRDVGAVVAVDLRSRPGGRAVPYFEPTLSGWTVLWQRLHPRRPSLRLPGPAATMLRAKELGGKDAHRRRRAAADVLLEPPVGGVDSMNFKAALPLAEAAYRYALDALNDQGL